MKVKIKEKEIELKYTFLSLMLYEQVAGEAFNANTISAIITYLYCTIIASHKGLDLPFDEYMKWLDENPNTINEFSEWLIVHNQTQKDLNANTEEKPNADIAKKK